MPRMKIIIKSILSSLLQPCLPLCMVLFAISATAQDVAPRQEQSVIRQTVEHFLHIQSAGLPGLVGISVGAIDPRMNLAACAAPEAFLPSGSRAWGKTTVGVRCTAPTAWTIYIQANVSVTGDYISTATAMSQGQIISANDLAKTKGDLTTLPAGIVTDPGQAIGRTLGASLPAGTPLRMDVLRSQLVIQQGQVVRIVSNGPGFRVSGEGRAMTNGSEGQMVQVRTQSGQLISGVAKAGGVVEVAYQN